MQLRARGHDCELPAIKYEFNKLNFTVQLLLILCDFLFALLIIVQFSLYSVNISLWLSYLYHTCLLTCVFMIHRAKLVIVPLTFLLGKCLRTVGVNCHNGRVCCGDWCMLVLVLYTVNHKKVAVHLWSRHSKITLQCVVYLLICGGFSTMAWQLGLLFLVDYSWKILMDFNNFYMSGNRNKYSL